MADDKKDKKDGNKPSMEAFQANTRYYANIGRGICLALWVVWTAHDYEKSKEQSPTSGPRASLSSHQQVSDPYHPFDTTPVVTTITNYVVATKNGFTAPIDGKGCRIEWNPQNTVVPYFIITNRDPRTLRPMPPRSWPDQPVLEGVNAIQFALPKEVDINEMLIEIILIPR